MFLEGSNYPVDGLIQSSTHISEGHQEEDVPIPIDTNHGLVHDPARIQGPSMPAPSHEPIKDEEDRHVPKPMYQSDDGIHGYCFCIAV